jgi:hypothetical protein
VLTWVRRLNTDCFVFLYDAFAERMHATKRPWACTVLVRKRFAERMHATKRPWACTVLVRKRFTETLFSSFELFNSLSIDDGLCLIL